MSPSVFGFFGLNENPFSINPNPRFLYLTPLAQAACQRLVDGIRERKGLLLLTGEVGTGKTLLIRRLLDWLAGQKIPTALVFNSHVDAEHLLDFILNDFGVSCDSQLKSDKLLALNRWLLDRYRAGQTPVLIVDEAQGLPLQALEEVRLLLNLETPRQKLLQVVLSGQPELEEKLKSYELRQLRQRITVRCRTAPLTMPETRAYIEERLRKAGAKTSIFQPQASVYVHGYSRGVPRVVNLLCEHSLINACSEGSRVVSPELVERAARDCQLDQVESISRMLRSSYLAGTDSADIGSVFSAVAAMDPDTVAEGYFANDLSNPDTLRAAAVAPPALIDVLRAGKAATSAKRADIAFSWEQNAAAASFAPADQSVGTDEPGGLSTGTTAESRTGRRTDSFFGQVSEPQSLPTRANGPQQPHINLARISVFEAWWKGFAKDARSSYRQIHHVLRKKARGARSRAEGWMSALQSSRRRLQQASNSDGSRPLHQLLTDIREALTANVAGIHAWLREFSAERSSVHDTRRYRPARKSSVKRSPNIGSIRRWLQAPLSTQRPRGSKELPALQRRRHVQP